MGMEDVNQLLGEVMTVGGCADFWTNECLPT